MSNMTSSTAASRVDAYFAELGVMDAAVERLKLEKKYRDKGKAFRISIRRQMQLGLITKQEHGVLRKRYSVLSDILHGRV